MTSLDIPVLHTERLLLRGMTEADVDGYEAMYSDERVYQWFGDRASDRAEMWRSIAMHLGHWALRGYGQWSLEHRVTGELIGRAGLWYPEGWPGLEVGWAVAPTQWQRGYATEAGTAAVAWAFSTLDTDEVISVTQPHNAASRRVMAKVGLAYDRTEAVAGQEQVIYRIGRDEWERRG
jgi:RimJ/RimL family protein N-acetyltransferase